MPYDQASFLAGVAAGRNMESWPADDGVGEFRFTVLTDSASTFYTPWMVFKGTINWGDGSSSSYDNIPANWTFDVSHRARASHNYPHSGAHQITLRGILLDWSTNHYLQVYETNRYLLTVDTPFPSTMWQRGNFDFTFNASYSLVRLPSNLFAMVNPTSLLAAFRQCDSLVSLPSMLFRGCETVESAIGLFILCDGLTDLPPDLFAGLGGVTDMTDAFYGCENLEAIPPGLFDPLENVINADQMFHSTKIKAIPEHLLDNCTSLRSVKGTFYGTKITYIPLHLFDNTPDIEEFSSCFYHCYDVEGRLPELWNMFPGAVGTNCFTGCSLADNYDDVPDDWK